MRETVSAESLAEKLRHEIDVKNKQVGGEGITLAKTVATHNPVTRDPVENDRCVAGIEDVSHPTTPFSVKAPSSEDS